ncbi:MAG: thiol reductant ABC exporter subunit CydC, partial [Rhodospirillales bacterium]
MSANLLRILGLWRGRAFWLLAGVLVSLAAVASAVGLLAIGGLALTGMAGLPLVLRYLGIWRVLLRYAERMVTHAAMFRALSDVRVWFFRRLAGGSAGGLGFRRAGDLLARLVGDVEALDGLYLRILVPLDQNTEVQA